MPSPHPAVTPAAIAIAIKYGKNVSRGIQEMEKIILGQQMALDLYHKCDEARKERDANPYMPSYHGGKE